MAEAVKEIKTKNHSCASSRSWTAAKLLGEPPYHILESQMWCLPPSPLPPPGLLAQVCQARLAAWKKLPPKKGTSATLTKVLQGPDEPYSAFIS